MVLLLIKNFQIKTGNYVLHIHFENITVVDTKLTELKHSRKTKSSLFHNIHVYPNIP